MKTFSVTEYKPMGDLSGLQELNDDDSNNKPKPDGHDLLVKVKAVATNPIDYKRLANLGDDTADFGDAPPLTVGWDAAGVVEAVGDNVSFYKPGDEVMLAGDFGRPGAFAEYVLVSENIVGRKPKNLTFTQAAAEPLTSLTAWEGLVDQLKIPVNDKAANAGKTILVTGGAGGVATAAVQIAKKVLGLTVVATGSREESIEFVKKLGADHVINHHKDLAVQLKDLGFHNVDYVFHGVELSPELFSTFTDIVKPFGGILSIWPSATVDLMKLFWKSINFSAVLMFTRPGLKENSRQHDILETLADLFEEGVLVSRQTQDFSPLTVDNLRKALELQASGKAVGKITLTF